MTFGTNFRNCDKDVTELLFILMKFILLNIVYKLMSQNLKLADKKFKKGEDNLTTGVFQWSKDYTSGASNFS